MNSLEDVNKSKLILYQKFYFRRFALVRVYDLKYADSKKGIARHQQ